MSSGFIPVRRTALVQAVMALALLWVVAVHAILLWERISDGSIARPEVASRWLAAAGIVVALALIRRWRATLRFGRASVVALWIIAALLHAAVPLDDRAIETANEWTALAQNLAAAFTAILALATVTRRFRTTQPHSHLQDTLTLLRPLLTPALSASRAPPAA